MDFTFRAELRFALSLTLGAFAFAPLVQAAPVPPLAVSPQLIPLPLNPVVPAGQRLCTTKTSSGLGYSVLRAASGPKPGSGDVVLINYIGYLAASGMTFDQAMSSPLPVGQVIPGFGEGMKLISKGGIYRLCVPAALGYGTTATGPIPANSALVFQVEVIDFRSLAEIEAAQQARSQAAKPAQ